MSLPDNQNIFTSAMFGDSSLLDGGPGRVRLRTLVWLRWFAILGQSASLVLVKFGLGYDLPLLWCFALIFASVVVNIALTLAYPLSRLLSNNEAVSYLAFDLMQLTGLLYLTGGVQNPFALLFLAPVTISASRLTLKSTIALVAMAFLCVTCLAIFHQPLPWAGDEVFNLPMVYVVGLWTALLFGIGFTATYAWRLSMEASHMSEALTLSQLVLAREQKLSALGGLAAAAAHELGTPLATIQLVARELEHEVPKDSELAEDVALIASQAARCRDILSELSRSPEDGDEMVSRAPVSVFIEEVASPHFGMGIGLSLRDVGDKATEPKVWRRPEILHGLSSFVENAVDFAHSQVAIITTWDDDTICVKIYDNGPGFAPEVLARLGEPYVTTRPQNRTREDALRQTESGIGGGMGLGFFIAKTLLERTGGQVKVSNHGQVQHHEINTYGFDFMRGALVQVTWPRQAIEVESDITPR